MLANEPTQERAVSIILVLAVLAFVALLVVAMQTPFGRAGIAPRPIEPIIERHDLPEVDTAITSPQEAPPAGLDGSWSGTCRAGEHGWPDMPITLGLATARDGAVHARGTLAFIDRRTHAKLTGSMWNDRLHLKGEMTEIGGIGTVWKIEVKGRIASADRIVGSFIEIWPHPGSARMCSFDWQR